MDFIQLRAKNFLTLGDSGWVYLSNRGLNVLQGINDDDTSAESNGAGKSSIPDALCWALFGTTARGESGDDVVNNVAKKDCKVELLFRDGDSVYYVARYRKHSPGKNSTKFGIFNAKWPELEKEGFEDAGSTDLSKGTERETQAEIERVLGCSYDVFMAAIYAGQEQMPNLPAMTDKQLKLLIEQAAGVERLSAAYALSRTKALEAERTIKTLTDNLSSLNERASVTERMKADAISKEIAFEATRADREEIHRAEATRHAGNLSALLTQIAAANGAALLGERDGLTATLKTYNDAKDAHAKFIRENVLPIDNKIAVLLAAREALYKQTESLKLRIENVDEEMLKPCTECGKEHTPEERDTVTKHLNDELGICSLKTDSLHKELATLRGKKIAMEVTVEALEAAIPNVEATTTHIAELNRLIIALNSKKASAREEKAKRDQEIANAEAVLSAPNPHSGTVYVLTKQGLEIEKNTELVNDKLGKAQLQVEVQRDVSTVFGPAGVRAHILDTVTPFLNDRTADYLSVLSDGHISAVWTTLSRSKSGELREKFTIDVENDKGARTYKGLSGGEKRKVRLATMLALQDLVASRASKPISLWVGDEIDDALDDAGLERLMTILERKARERGTVIVISHNSLTDWCDSVTTVRKAGGVSTLEGALCL